jgi:hypothetical protein
MSTPGQNCRARLGFTVIGAGGVRVQHGYRLYFLGGTGRIERGCEIDCLHDDEAIRAAWSQATGAAMELWQGGRLVKTFPALPHTSSRR